MFNFVESDHDTLRPDLWWPRFGSLSQLGLQEWFLPPRPIRKVSDPCRILRLQHNLAMGNPGIKWENHRSEWWITFPWLFQFWLRWLSNPPQKKLILLESHPILVPRNHPFCLVIPPKKTRSAACRLWGAHLPAHFAQLLPLGFGKSGPLSDGRLGVAHCFSGVAGGCAETWRMGDGGMEDCHGSLIEHN